jgi:hypothetical protein
MPSKLTFDYVKNYIENHGCVLISTEYKHTKQLLELLCKCGKKWLTNFSNLRRKSYCRYCALEQRKTTILSKYGVENISQLNTIKIKKTETCMKNFGVEYPLQSKNIMNKTINTVQNKYGVCNVSKASCVRQKLENIKWTEKRREKFTKTSIEKFGVSHPFKSIKVREKIKKTMFERYGVKYPGAIIGHWDKAVKTWINKYGVSHPLHNDEFMIKNIKNHFSVRNYIFPRGKIVKILGYENIALDTLMSRGYDENDIFTSPIDMPRIWYYFNNKKCKYYPDIYIKSENKFIEVKSTFTLYKEYEKNKAKFNAIVDQKIELWCYNHKKQLEEFWFKVEETY